LALAFASFGCPPAGTDGGDDGDEAATELCEGFCEAVFTCSSDPEENFGYPDEAYCVANCMTVRDQILEEYPDCDQTWVEYATCKSTITCDEIADHEMGTPTACEEEEDALHNACPI
jgi:hypothetical protein